MKSEVAVFLVASLLLLQHPVVPADVRSFAASSFTGSQANRLGSTSNTAGALRILRPVGTEFHQHRPKRSPPDDAEYRAGGDVRDRRRPSMFQSDADVDDDSTGSWNSRLSTSIHRPLSTRRDWGQSDMTWIRRRSPASSGVLRPVADRRAWQPESGMEWIKRREDVGDEARVAPVNGNWEQTRFPWLKRSAKNNEEQMTNKRRHSADNWAMNPDKYSGTGQPGQLNWTACMDN